MRTLLLLSFAFACACGREGIDVDDAGSRAALGQVVGSVHLRDPLPQDRHTPDAGRDIDAGPSDADAGPSDDAGATDDAGASDDAGSRSDAGTSSRDAGAAASDAGSSDAGSSDAGSSDAGVADGGMGCIMVESSPPDEGGHHVDAGQGVDYHHNPPTSGNHWPIWATYADHFNDVDTVPREAWVHSMEHGGVVLLAGPNATPAMVQAIRDYYATVDNDPFCLTDGGTTLTKHALALADPLMDDTIAAVAWDHVLEGSCVNVEQIRAFLERYRGHAGNEHFCGDGQWP